MRSRSAQFFSFGTPNVCSSPDGYYTLFRRPTSDGTPDYDEGIPNLSIDIVFLMSECALTQRGFRLELVPYS